MMTVDYRLLWYIDYGLLITHKMQLSFLLDVWLIDAKLNLTWLDWFLSMTVENMELKARQSIMCFVNLECTVNGCCPLLIFCPQF